MGAWRAVRRENSINWTSRLMRSGDAVSDRLDVLAARHRRILVISNAVELRNECAFLFPFTMRSF